MLLLKSILDCHWITLGLSTLRGLSNSHTFKIFEQFEMKSLLTFAALNHNLVVSGIKKDVSDFIVQTFLVTER